MSIRFEQLLIAASFAELGVTDLGHVYIIDNRTHHKKTAFNHSTKIALNSDFMTVWATNNLNAPLKYLAQSPRASLFEREGITFSNLAIFLPELADWVTQKLEINENQVFMFLKPVWWFYYQYVEQESALDSMFIIEMNGKYNRQIFMPFYLDENMSIEAELAMYFAEGMPECSEIKSECVSKELSDLDYALKMWDKCESLPNIKNIKLSIRPKSSIIFEQYLSNSRLCILDEKIYSEYLFARNHDVTESLYAWEPRYINQEKTKYRIERESWLDSNYMKKINQINESIHAAVQNNFSEFELFFEGIHINKYLHARYHSEQMSGEAT